MIYDCFLFFSEFRVLELRLEELNAVVDQFVLVESAWTFSGKPKPLYFRENQQLFAKYLRKIRHVVVEDMPAEYQSAWDVEAYQRDAILTALTDAGPDDTIIVSDVDEIPRAGLVSSFVDAIAAVELEDFYYKLNCKNLLEKTVAPVLIRRSLLKTPQEARLLARRYWEHHTPILQNGGWHFSCTQDALGLKLKLESFSHQEFNTPELRDTAGIADRIKFGLDFVGRRDHYWCCVPLDQTFPSYLLQHQDRFQDLLFDFTQFHVNRQGLIYDLQDEKARADKLDMQLDEARSQIRELSSLVAKATRWKRGLMGLVMAPFYWVVGALVVLAEFGARLLRRVAKRPAPMASRIDATRCSIVIVSWEGRDLLSESLPALLKAVKFQGGNHEIIVVDNGSTDGTEEYLKDHYPQVRVIRNPVNEYFAGGNNLGVAAAKNDILVLLNNDMIVHEDFLVPLLAGFRSPDIFAVASQVFLADPSKRREETGKARASFNGCDLDWRHETVLPSDEEQQYVPVFWGHGGAVAVDRHKFQWLGGFDRLYDPFYVEDADLSYCAWKVGWRCLMAVQSKVIHKHRTSTSRFGKQFISQIVRRNQYLFLWKNFADFGKLLAHFARSPRVLVRRAGIPGIGIRVEMLAFLGAAERLPAVLRQKLRLARSVVRSDQEILEITNTPPDATIKSNHIDFALGSFSDQLGSGWHDLEVGEGRPYRWMTKQASVFLLAPQGEAEVLVQGYVPSLSSYEGSGVSLNVRCCGQQKHFAMKEGGFEYRWTVRDLPARLPVEVELWVNRTLSSGTDQRELGIALHSIGLLKHSDPVSRRRERLHSSISINGAGFDDAGNAQQRRVLMICAYLPCLGTHGGGNMMFNLIRHLSKSHRLTVLSFYEEESELSNVPQLARYCERLEILYRGQSFHTSNLFGLKPPDIVREFYHEGMERLVKSYLATQHFDLMQCEYLQTAHFANVELSIPTVLTNHEVLSLSRINHYRHLSWTARGKVKALISAMRMLNYEEKILRRFSAVVVLTEAEADFLARYAPSVPLQCHPMGVDCDFFSPAAESSAADNTDPKSVAFIGSFRHSPNATGAMWLLEQVWPLVVERLPSAQLYLVGNNPTPAMLKRHGKNNVTVTGWVDDVRPYLGRASVVVAPVFEGAGMRTKVLEAWAMAKAVVGTPLAFEGLSATDGEFSFIAADPDTFVQRILELLHDENLARGIGRRARELAISSFSWEAFAAFYANVYEQILRPREYGRSEDQFSGIQVTKFPAAEKVERR